MEKTKNPFSIREFIIALSIGIVLLILGNIFDFDISSSIYDPINTSYFGIIMSGICELPVCFCLSFGGSILIIGRDRKNKNNQIFAWIIGILSMIVAVYFTYDTFLDIYKFNSTSDYKILITILGIVLALVFNSLVVFLSFKLLNKYDDKKTLFIFGFYLIILVALVALVATTCKYLWSRPRPRYIFNELNPNELFSPVYVLNPFHAIKNGDNFKSFPSGHTTYASTLMFVLPLIGYLFNKNEDKKTNILLFYIGLIWAILSALSRIVAGAHFLSDVSFGLIITSASSLLINKIMFRK